MCGVFRCITRVEIQVYYNAGRYKCIFPYSTHVSNTCVGYTLVLHMYSYKCNKYVEYTPVFHVWNICTTCILHMYYMCMNYMFNTPKPNTCILHVYPTCNTHVAYLVLVYDKTYWKIELSHFLHQSYLYFITITLYDVIFCMTWK